MRDSLKKSFDDSPVKGFERYPKGSIVLCNGCAKPIAKLDYSIALGEKSGRLASAFKPLSVADLYVLEERDDVDAGVVAMIKSWSVTDRLTHCASLVEFRSGDPMMCPICKDCFVQVLAVEKNELLDKAYTIELLTIPPVGIIAPAVRGKHIGAKKDWVH